MKKILNFFKNELIVINSFNVLTLIFLLFVMVMVSCTKNITEENDNFSSNSLQKLNYSWNKNEARFFLGKEYLQRNGASIIYHPMLFSVIRNIAEENSTQHFIENLQENIGNPMWSNSIVYFNPEDKSNLVLVPFEKEGVKFTTGVLSVSYNRDGTSKNYIKNGISRPEIFNYENGNANYKINFAKAFIAFDKKLFDHVDIVLLNILCEYEKRRTRIIDNEGCVWRNIEVCWKEDDPQTWWYPGGSNPDIDKYRDLFDGDHDNDGIPDMDDQDYGEWRNRFEDFWDDLGIDGDLHDFWDGDHDNDGVPDNVDTDWGSWWDDFGEWWDDFWDHVSDGWDDFLDWWDDITGDLGDWWDDLWDGDIDCYEFPLQGKLNSRSLVICETFWVLDCGTNNGGIGWVDKFKYVINCPGCPNSNDQEDLIRAMIPGLINFLNITGISNEDLFLLIRTCDPSSSDFIECVKLKIDKFKKFSNELGNSSCPNGTPDLKEELEKFVIEKGLSDEAIAAAEFHFNFICQSAPNYKSYVSNLSDWVKANSINSYLATATLYSAALENGMWSLPDKETLYFYWILFERELLPIGITFLPYGIGDAADIFQSCGGLSWGCFFALGGVLIPFDEMVDMWRNSDKVKDAWKAVESYAHLKGAWTKIYNKFPQLAKNLDAVKYVDDLAEPKFGPYFATSNTYASNYKNKFSEVASEIQAVHHAVPREIEYNFQLVSNSDINSLENLRGMPSIQFHQNLTNIWNDFLRPYKQSGTKPTIEALLSKAKEIDNQFGKDFIPPIR